MTARVGVIDYDLGNLPSVTKALERAGAAPVLVGGPEGLDETLDAVVLPGVGHFGAGMRNLTERGLTAPLREWAASGRPFLGICVGLQLLFECSEEDPDVRGLGIVDGEVRRLRAPRVPHMGWNTVEVLGAPRIANALAPEDMVYFVHSYVVRADPGVVSGSTEYGHVFPSVIEHGNVVGFQFHPEKSADVGRKLLERFVASL